jgi:hypothetical protein
MKAKPLSNLEARPLVALENSFGFWCALDAFLEAPGEAGPAQALASTFGSTQLDLKPLVNAYVESGKILKKYQQELATRAKPRYGKGYRLILGKGRNNFEASPAFTEFQYVIVSLYLVRTLPEHVSGVDFYRVLTRLFLFAKGWQANAIWTRPEDATELFNRTALQMESGEIIRVEPPKHTQCFPHPQSLASGPTHIKAGIYLLTDEGQLEPLSEMPEHDSLGRLRLVPAEQLPVAYEEAGKIRVTVAYLAESLLQGGSRCYLIPFAEPMSLEQVADDKALQSKWKAFVKAIDALRPKSLPISDVTQQRDALLKQLVGILNDNYPNVSKHARYVAAGSLAVLLGLLDTEVDHKVKSKRLGPYTNYLKQWARNAEGSKARL